MEVNMIIEEEHGNQKAESPALTEATSCTSSPEPSPLDDFKNNSIRRNLFKIDGDGNSLKETIDSPGNYGLPSTSLICREATITPIGGENGLADTTSTTSSETTAIPSWNLSMKDAIDKNVEVPLDHFILSQPVPLMSLPPTFPLGQTKHTLSTPLSFASDETQLSDDRRPQLLEIESLSHSPNKLEDKENIDVRTKQTKKPSVVVEDPPEEPTSCNAALNLAEIVFAFGQSARQRYQGSEQTENSTTSSNPTTRSSTNKSVLPTKGDTLVGSPPSIMTSRHLSESSSQSEKSQNSFIRSLERELDTFKTSTKHDAYTISKLQQAINTQKQLNSLKEDEIVDKEVEIQILEKRIRTIQKEPEDYLDREIELRETIKILKKELDKMTLLDSAPSDELEHLKLKSEPSSDDLETKNLSNKTNLAESRAKDQQARIMELEMALKQTEEENFELQKKIDWLNDLHEGGNDEKHQKAVEKEKFEKLDVNDSSEEEQIESLLKDIMKRLEAVEIERNEKESDLTKNVKENSEEKKCILNQIDSGHNDVKINVSEDPDAIETMTLNEKAKKVEDSGNQSTLCCDWSLIYGE